MGVEIKGEKELDQNLKLLAAQSKSARNKGLKKSAEYAGRKLAEKTAYNADRKSDRKWKAQRQFEKASGTNKKFPHLKDDVQVSGVSSMGEIKIGYGEDTYWRAHFVETGTINQSGQHFMQRTELEIKEEVISIMAEVFKKELGL